MAVNYSDLTPGTAVTWKNTAGDKDIPAKNMATATAVQGAKSATLVDGTKGFPELLEITVETKVQATPTDGKELNLYLGFSNSATIGTDNPGALLGSGATMGDLDVLPQLAFVGAVVMAGSLSTGLQRQDAFEVAPKKEYFIPVLHNDTGQTTSNVDGETSITVRPWYRRTPIA